MKKGVLALGIIILLIGIPLLLSPSFLKQPNQLASLACINISTKQTISPGMTSLSVSGIMVPTMVGIQFTATGVSSLTVLDSDMNVVATIPAATSGAVLLFLPAGDYTLVWAGVATISYSVFQYNLGLQMLLQQPFAQEPIPITSFLVILGIVCIIAGIVLASYGALKKEKS